MKNGASVTILNVTAEGKLSTTGSIAVGTSLPANGKFEIVGTTGDHPNNFATGYGVNGSFLGRRANGTEGSPTALTSGQNIVVFGGRGYGATGFSASSRVSIQMRSAEAWTDTAQGTSIGFYTTTMGTASSSEKLTLFDNGNLLTYGINMSNSKSVITTNLLTAATITTEYTYFTGTAGASFAITLPAASSSIDGMFITIVSSVLRASTTWISTGATFVGVPTSLSINTPIKLQYHHATLQWFVTA